MRDPLEFRRNSGISYIVSFKNDDFNAAEIMVTLSHPSIEDTMGLLYNSPEPIAICVFTMIAKMVAIPIRIP